MSDDKEIFESGKKALDILQETIILFVNKKDDESLAHLQTCVGELFRRASVCRKENKLMEITDDDSHETDDGDTLH